LHPFELPAKRSIDGQWEFLLMEAARVRDETMAAQASATGPVPPLETKPAFESSTTAFHLAARVEETLICSGQGEPLYAWQCPDTSARVALLQNMAQQAASFGQLIPLGNFDRLEIQLTGSRVVAQARADRLVFVRVSTGGEKSATQFR
jgi:hypothetical protein